MNNTTNRLMIFFLSLISSTIIYGLFLTFYPYRTLEVKYATVKTETVKAGDVLVYTVDYCKYTDKPAIVYRTIHSVNEANTIPYPSIATITTEGCRKTDVPLQTFADPNIMPPGTYFLLVDVDFKINALRNIHVQFKTNNFEVK